MVIHQDIKGAAVVGSIYLVDINARTRISQTATIRAAEIMRVDHSQIIKISVRVTDIL